MVVGGVKRGLRPRSSVHTDEVYFNVAETALEVQEMQELAMLAGAPWKLLEFTCSPGGDVDDVPWDGKPVLVRADLITYVGPPAHYVEDDE